MQHALPPALLLVLGPALSAQRSHRSLAAPRRPSGGPIACVSSAGLWFEGSRTNPAASRSHHELGGPGNCITAHTHATSERGVPPVLSSQPHAPRCAMRWSIISASVMHLRDACLESSPTKPTPQASRSFAGSNSPWAGGTALWANVRTSSRLPSPGPAGTQLPDSSELGRAAGSAPAARRGRLMTRTARPGRGRCATSAGAGLPPAAAPAWARTWPNWPTTCDMLAAQRSCWLLFCYGMPKQNVLFARPVRKPLFKSSGLHGLCSAAKTVWCARQHLH